MFEAKLVKGNLWKKLVGAIKEMIQESRWEITKDRGISMQAMDSSHVCLVSVFLSSDGFDDFRCDHNMTMGTKLASMSKILSCSGGDDIVTLRADGNDTDVLTFIFQSPKSDRVSDFELKLMDIDSENMGIPDNESAVTIAMPSSEFNRIAHDLSNMGENVTICGTKDGVSFSSAGDLGKGNIKLVQTSSIEKEEEAVIIEMNEPCAQTFTTKMLQNIARASTLNSRIMLSLSNDNPLVAEYKLVNPEQSENFGFLRYYLAPKMEDDDMS